VEREQQLLEDVHKTEEEIDLFLEHKKHKAGEILEEGSFAIERMRENLDEKRLYY